MERDNQYNEIENLIGKQIPIEDPVIEDPAEANICISCE